MSAKAPEPIFLSSITAHSWNQDHTQVALSPNSHLVWIYDASSGEDPKKWKKLHELSEHFMTVTGIDWNHETGMIATSGQDRNAYVWSLIETEWKPTLVILRFRKKKVIFYSLKFFFYACNFFFFIIKKN